MLRLFILAYVSLVSDYVAEAVLPADRIIGGTISEIGQFPYFAQLSIGIVTANGTIMTVECGGTLIEPLWILTAAHCFSRGRDTAPPYMYKNNFVVAYMGSDMMYPYADKIAIRYIEKAVIHPNYTFRKVRSEELYDNDVAVARLKRPFILSDLVATVHLPKKRSKPCRTGVIIGSGVERYSKNRSRHVEYATVRTRLSYQISLKPRIPRYRILYTETGWHHGSPVAGDMGGPLVCVEKFKHVQYGIMSNYYNNFRKRTIITQFESVNKYLDFIFSHVPLHLVRYVRPKKHGKVGPHDIKPIAIPLSSSQRTFGVSLPIAISAFLSCFLIYENQ